MGRRKKTEIIEIKYPRIILGLDVSTTCIGVSILMDKGAGKPEILLVTHVAPKVSRKAKGIESLCYKKKIFKEEFMPTIMSYGITDVIIEEPLLSSNNINTVATLLRFNGMISDAVYETLHIIPKFISSYDAREYSFPQLVTLRKYNKKGEEYTLQHIQNAIKKNHLVLFGSYPFDIDKKQIMMDLVKEEYPDIDWIKDKNGDLRKENYDACDSIVCVLAYININRYKVEKPIIADVSFTKLKKGLQITYKTKIWDKVYDKKIILENS